MSEAVGQPKCCVFFTNNSSDSSLYFVQLVDNFHPSEISAFAYGITTISCVLTVFRMQYMDFIEHI